MPTARTTTPKPSPTKTAAPSVPELTTADRLIADLRVLVDIAAASPAVAEQLASTLDHVHIVVPAAGLAVVDELDAKLVERSATQVPGADEPMWPTRSWLLPNRAVQVSATRLAVPVDDFAPVGTPA